MLAKRIATALVLLAVVLGTLRVSENVFLAALGLAFAITLFECTSGEPDFRDARTSGRHREGVGRSFGV